MKMECWLGLILHGIVSLLVKAFWIIFYNLYMIYLGSKYMLNPELRARRIVNVIQYSSIEFYKAFLFLGETGKLLKKNC